MYPDYPPAPTKSNSKPWDAPMTDEEAELPVNLRIRTGFVMRRIQFNQDQFDLLKTFQQVLEGQVRRHLTNAEVLAYLIQTHPEIAAL
jgi:hypothetical protein